MRKLISICVLIAAAASFLLADEDAQIRRDILGLRLNMAHADVQKRLNEIGTFVREERKQQEIWTARDDTFSHVAIGFDKQGQLRYVTAVARADEKAKRMRYEEVGPLAAAKQAGDPAIKNFNFVWSLPEEDGQPEMQVIARGRDETFLDTYTLKRNESEPAAEEKDEE